MMRGGFKPREKAPTHEVAIYLPRITHLKLFSFKGEGIIDEASPIHLDKKARK